MLPFATYKCPDCGHEKRLPEPPRTGERYVRTGCDWCGSIKMHLRLDVWTATAGMPGVGWR